MIELLLYEAKPFLCVYFGVSALRNYSMHAFGVAPAVVLVLCGFLILSLRLDYRLFGRKRR